MKSLILSRKGLVVLIMLLMFLSASRMAVFDSFSYSVYDYIRMLEDPQASNVVVVALDEKSLSKIGSYPVSFATHLRVLENLVTAGAEQVAYVGMPSLHGLTGHVEDTLSSPPVAGQDLDNLTGRLRNQRKIIAGIPFVSTAGGETVQQALPGYLLQNTLPKNNNSDFVSAQPAYYLSTSAAGPASEYGVVFVDNEEAAELRKLPLFVEANGLLLPSLALQMYLRTKQLSLSDVSLQEGKSISLAGENLPADEKFQLWPYLYPSSAGSAAMVTILSYHDVLHGAVSADSLNGKIVLLGITARGLSTAVKVPAGQSAAPVLIVASTLASMLNNQVIAVPAWGSLVSSIFLVLIATVLLWLFLLKPKARLAVTVVLVLILLLIELLFLLAAGIWLDLMPAIILLLTGFVVISLMGSAHSHAGKAPAMSGEVHRRVGLAAQKRGELDSAFESFRKCPLENSIMVLLFYLAQDFAEAGRHDRAVAVYQYMESFNPHYKNLQENLEKARMVQETVLMDESKIAPAVNTAITAVDEPEDGEANDGEQRLGRYIVEHEIGKGAMGLVYRGRDPKINRTVAIKTLNIKSEFDEDEQENVLGRFFHEAEAAGRLHHPHIVTIYDAGEHNELAYIAMEFLTGSDLRVYTKQGTLLPPLTVVKIGMKLAGALDYAHNRDIVHRDIKAANVMYDPSSGQLKVTDFGIARLTDSRRTKTGMVLGTPSSMSPEQLRGKKLDGRTDLYSLGVLMFQLMTGRLPYKAESLTQLMYKITNEEPPDLFDLRPDLKENGECVRDVIKKLLQKDADDRYQDGKKLARDLLSCAKKMASRK